MSVSRTVSETLSVGVTLKTVLQSTAKTVVPTKSYQILNRFSLNGHFRHAVYVAIFDMLCMWCQNAYLK